ncbi:histidine phosphatase superfamily [Aspergillus pseudotamarii]|uniref:Histidine phosphatase superfamily n=1 Tax=Aspergillus pseudotamarii TaxID=132259 RepID=A0A5N6TBS9_ASPPS|nr:histidine phosphatase superfamily [Aspergillus pseudotamarii]KAE8143730.1 histidine phosphatase superfamily [Aspergillus pseudotamarii]
MHLLPVALLFGALVAPTASESFNPLNHLAGIAPYRTINDPPIESAPPQGCNVTKAAYLIRHAAIYANDFDYETYLEPFVKKLGNTTQDWSKTTDLKFLTNWTAPVDEEHLEKVTKVGYKEAVKLGVNFRTRYASLSHPNKVWSSSADRTTKTAAGFIEGYTLNKTAGMDLVEVKEKKDTGVDSLTPYKSCPAYSGSYGSDQSQEWVEKYTAPIKERLNAQAPNFNFTTSDIVSMFEFCGYETVIRGDSPFCATTLFSSNDWLSFEYGEDIRYFHNVGYGNHASPRIGFPWVNASFNVLSTNSNQDVYVSFTHRELPPTVITALGLFNNSAFSGADNVNKTMPTDKLNYGRQWKSSDILPFLTNIAIEKMSCDSYGYDEGDYYRVLVNSSPQPLEDCRGGPGDSCNASKFKDFVKGLGERFGDFVGACGAPKNESQVVTIYN